MQIAIADAKAHFAELIRKAEAGEAIVITRHGRPVAELRAAGQGGRRPLLGAMEGQFTLPKDIATADPELAELFEGGQIPPTRP